MDNDELRLRHLDTIQQVITRLAQNSFTIRGWSVSLVTVVFAIIGTQGQSSPHLVLVALAPTWIFWTLDAYYLHQERQYRHLYATAAHRLRDGPTAPDIPPFDMNPRQHLDQGKPWTAALISPPVAAIPTTLTAIIAIYWISQL